jgi:hypothetical protein
MLDYWFQFAIYLNQTEESAVHCFHALHRACPVKIKTILTDINSQFTDRFTSKEKMPSGQYRCRSTDTNPT